MNYSFSQFAWPCRAHLVRERFPRACIGTWVSECNGFKHDELLAVHVQRAEAAGQLTNCRVQLRQSGDAWHFLVKDKVLGEHHLLIAAQRAVGDAQHQHLQPHRLQHGHLVCQGERQEACGGEGQADLNAREYRWYSSWMISCTLKAACDQTLACSADYSAAPALHSSVSLDKLLLLLWRGACAGHNLSTRAFLAFWIVYLMSFVGGRPGPPFYWHSSWKLFHTGSQINRHWWLKGMHQLIWLQELWQ